jgi:hypothetical protein
MAQLTIVTTPQNSGDGTPLSTSFNYCNSNFSELYARFQVDPPASLIGTTGDVAGMYAVDSTYFYYCFDTYDGTSTIWGQVTQVGNISVSSISSGTSNVKISDVNGNATTSIGGTSNVVVVATTGQFVSGLVSATGNVRGSFILGNGSQLTGLPQSYSDSNVVTLLSTFGSNVISTTGTITSGNVTGGNVLTGGRVSATGNIVTDQYFVGNFFGNVTGNFVVPGSNTQVLFNTNGNADATAGFTFNKDSNTLIVLGVVSSSGNVIAGNVSTAGNITAGNLSATNITGTLTTVTQNNITSVGTLSSVTVTANVAGGNLTTGGQVSAAGNIRTAAYLFVAQDINVTGDITSTSYTGTSSSLSGNVTGGNIRTAGQVSAAGNVTGNYILGNIAFANGIATNTIQNGNSNVLVGSSAGNVSINVNGIGPIAIFTPLGQTTTGVISATGTVTAGNIATGGTISALGNITGGNLTLNSASSNITAHDITVGGMVSAIGNITGGNISATNHTGTTVSVTGNITGGNLTVGTGTITVGSIVNANANAVGNIGSSSNYFNTVFAQSTSAQYADLAENYTSDAEYAPGTVVIFGGEKEITVTTEAADERVAGVVSTKPAYLMNAESPGLAVALRGKVPVQVIGPVNKGDGLVTSTTPGVAISVGRRREYAQAVFAKSLETDNCPDERVILAVIL